MSYQETGVHVDGGGNPEVFPLPTLSGPPTLSIAQPFTPGTLGPIGCQGHGGPPHLDLGLAGNAGQEYGCTGRHVHSALSSWAFFSMIYAAPPGPSQIPHGLVAQPDHYHMQYADLPADGPVSLYGVDAVDVFVNNEGAVPVNVAIYAWILHSIERHDTSGPHLATLIPAGGPSIIAHGLRAAPDLAWFVPAKPIIALAPNAAAIPIWTASTATEVWFETSEAIGNPLIGEVFAQITHSIQR